MKNSSISIQHVYPKAEVFGQKICHKSADSAHKKRKKNTQKKPGGVLFSISGQRIDIHRYLCSIDHTPWATHSASKAATLAAKHFVRFSSDFLCVCCVGFSFDFHWRLGDFSLVQSTLPCGRCISGFSMHTHCILPLLSTFSWLYFAVGLSFDFCGKLTTPHVVVLAAVVGCCCFFYHIHYILGFYFSYFRCIYRKRAR